MNKIVIYQVLPRLWGNMNKDLVKGGTLSQNGSGKFSDFTTARLRKIAALGATHIWYTGVLEHATTTDYSTYGIDKDNPQVVKGKAGSPYAVKDYYDVDPDLADDPAERKAEFIDLISRSHEAGLKVLMDFVPNHVARHYHSDSAPEGIQDFGSGDNTSFHFSPHNNFYYLGDTEFRSPQQSTEGEEYRECPAKATGNDCFSPSPGVFDWYDTVKLNYGVDIMAGRIPHFDPMPDTWSKMTDILKYWCSFGVDGFRCDMSEMVPVEFWHYAVTEVRRKYPDVIFIAEIYNPSLYRSYTEYGGFDYLYDKVGLYDKLHAVVRGECRAGDIQYTWQAVGELKPRMLSFMENHDEVRIASAFFAGNADKGRPAMIVSALMNTNPVMIYFGQEYGEEGMDDEGYSRVDGRTSIYDYWSTDKMRRALCNPGKLTAEEKALHLFYKRLLMNVCREEAVREGLFYDLTYCNTGREDRYDASALYSFIRRSRHETLLVVANFSVEEKHADILIPSHAFDFLNLAEGEYKMRDLLLQRSSVSKTELKKDGTVSVKVPPFYGCALKLYH